MTRTKNSKAKDPVCGMTVSKNTQYKGQKEGITYYFCSRQCMGKFMGTKNMIPVALGAILITLSLISVYTGYMIQFMGAFFIIVSLLKVIDWKGFASAFAMYDIIAKRSRIYAMAYPAIEFAIGILFLINAFVFQTAILTFAVMTIGSVGVMQNLLSKNKVRCACLGTKINVPLTKFTLLEDILMAVMSLLLIWMQM